MKLFLLIGLTFLLLTVEFSSILNAGKGGDTLNVGDAAPKFSLPGNDGKTYALSDFAGKKVVLYFYPKDQTPGCTKEACAFRDRNTEIQAKGAMVFGLNTDSVESHQKFVEKYHLTFPLLSDTKGDTVKAYGAKGGLGFTKRITYIIDGKGNIAKIFPSVSVDKHADEVIQALGEIK